MKLAFKIQRGGTEKDVEHETVRFAQDVVKIGTLPSSHIHLDDPKASRMHAVVEIDSDRVSILDLGSLAGTIVNGTRVNRAILKTGDQIRLGDTTLIIQIEP